MSALKNLYRLDLKSGDLYYIYEIIQRQKHSDLLEVWVDVSSVYSAAGRLTYIPLNEHNPFVFLETQQDTSIDSLYWFRVITRDGYVGWFGLCDGDMPALMLCFKKAKVPSE